MTEFEKEYDGSKAAAAFDTTYTTNHIRILKTLLPFLGSNEKNGLAILIRFLELEYTFQYAASHPFSVCEENEGKKALDFPLFFRSIKGLLNDKERAMLDKLVQMQDTMKNVQEMMQMMEMMQELNPEMFSPGTEADQAGASQADGSGTDTAAQGGGQTQSSGSPFGGMNPMELLKGMLSPEQAAMFELFESKPEENAN